jgi:hypothetical protein
MVDLTVPDYAVEWVRYWQDKLGMWEWMIKLRLELILDNNEMCRGLTENHTHINLGRIGLRADLEDTAEWEVTLLHELLHVKHSRIDAMVYEVLGPQLGLADGMLQALYNQALEPYIESMANCLVGMRRDAIEIATPTP